MQRPNLQVQTFNKYDQLSNKNELSKSWNDEIRKQIDIHLDVKTRRPKLVYRTPMNWRKHIIRLGNHEHRCAVGSATVSHL